MSTINSVKDELIKQQNRKIHREILIKYFKPVNKNFIKYRSTYDKTNPKTNGNS